MAASLDKTIAEATTHHNGVKAELDAVNEYLEGLNMKCTYKKLALEMLNDYYAKVDKARILL